MQLDWLGSYRKIVADYYRSANGYSQICKTEMFGIKVKFSPYEVQIMEHILEHADENRNMKWYAEQLGLSQATYSKYVRKLVSKGLVEKYHTEDNQKNIILQVTDLGLREYEGYVRQIWEENFAKLFAYWDTLSPEQLEAVRMSFSIWSGFHGEFGDQAPKERGIRLIKIK